MALIEPTKHGLLQVSIMLQLFKRLLLLAALLPLIASADEVPADRARMVAEHFLTQGKQTRATAPQLTLRWTGDRPATRGAETAEPAFYVFEQAGGGYVIVAGDDRIEPILAYSKERSFDPENMPANLRAWMQKLQEFIFRLRAEGRPASAQVAEQWNGFGVSRAEYTPLLYQTAQWNQEAPYNNLCPTVDGKRAVTGCVATATAIVMRWNQWPEAGTGKLPGYQYYSDKGTRVSVPGHELGHTYDWSGMPLTDAATGRWTAKQREAVAQLMYDCGVMAQMQYNYEGSGAISMDALEGLTIYMHYDKSALYRVKCVYPADTWKQMVRDNLANYGPMLYDGVDENLGGHCFVLDGYDENGLFHINFGWGGHFNDYYAFPNFDDFVYGHMAGFGIKPDAGGESVPSYLTMEPFVFNAGTKQELALNGMEVIDGELGYKTPFLLLAGAFVNYKGEAKGQLGVAHIDQNGTFKEVLPSYWLADDQDPSGLAAGYVTAYYIRQELGKGQYGNLQIAEPIEEGDQLIMVYRHTANDPWEAIPYDVETPGFVGAIDLMSSAEAEAPSIEEHTAFAYDKSARIITLTTLEGTKIVLLRDGKEVLSGSAAKSPFTIQTGDLAAGRYTIRLTLGEDSKEVEIILGTNE